MSLQSADRATLESLSRELEEEYRKLAARGLKLDLTRGKPSSTQLDLSNALDGILGGDYTSEDGTDLRNYGGLEGLPEARRLFAAMIDVEPDDILVGGSSSLTLMYQAVLYALYFGATGSDTAWRRNGEPIKFLAPVPGYDRHFGVCEDLDIDLIPVPMRDDGPDMDEVERLVSQEPFIKGIWCVPRFSNPTGIVYSDAVVERFATLAKKASPHFRIFWDNAYAVHSFDNDAPALAPLMERCRAHGTEDSVYIFGSTSKITFAGAGVSFVAMSAANQAAYKRHLGFSQIGPDKVNQMRHVRFLKDMDTLKAHMARHAEIVRPRFEAVLQRLCDGLDGLGIADWTEPRGGYFISFNTLPGLAREVVRLAAEAGVKLTPAGATWPHGRDPRDCNIRLAPTVPSIENVEQATDVFVTCVKLATVRHLLQE